MPIVLNGSGPITGVTSLNTTVSDTEIGYLDGVTSALQTQINTAGGLVKITDQTFSAASAVNVNSCFTSTYENYLVEVLVSAASTNSQVFLRLRVSGTDATASEYAYANRYLRLDGNASGTGVGLLLSSMQLAAVQHTVYGCAASITVMGPQTTQFTRMFGHAVNYQSSQDAYLYTNGCMHKNTTAYDGMTVACDSGTITGTLRVYGFRN